MKVVIFFEDHEDGGLRAYSDDVPGFVLSHSDRGAVLADVRFGDDPIPQKHADRRLRQGRG
jgi:hypothetical protein